MAEEAESEDLGPEKKSKMPIVIGIVLALVLGGGSFFSVYSGLILSPSGEENSEDMAEKSTTPLPSLAFVPIDPIVINLGKGSANRHLKFRAELEVDPGAQKEVSSLLPKITDVLNGYLRAVKIEELEQPSALIKLRSQMLRRVQIVTGEDRVRDLLVMEFVLN